MNSQNVSDLPLVAQPPKPVIRHYRRIAVVIVLVVIVACVALFYSPIGRAALDSLLTNYINCG